MARKIIGLCIPGNQFPGEWLDPFMELYTHLLMNYILVPFRGYTSSVAHTRGMLAQAVTDFDHPMGKPEYVFWLDHDNCLSPDQFDSMVQTLDSHQEIDAVSAWCYIKADKDHPEGRVSCGWVSEDGRQQSATAAELSGSALLDIDWSGFPAVLMRRELLTRGGQFPFAPFVGPEYSYGASGEDFAFCRRVIEAGARWVVDTRIHIPHLKLGPIEPPIAKAQPVLVGAAA